MAHRIVQSILTVKGITMAKLIYLYIKNIDRKIIEQDINFSTDFNVSYNNGELKVNKNMYSDMNGFWGKKVENMTLLIGKNGVGKTSILDLIGTNDKTRMYNFKKGKYFLVFHLYDDYYYFKGTMSKDIKNLQNDSDKKESFFFEASAYNKFYKSSLGHLDQFKDLNIYYSRNKIKYPWVGEKKIYRRNSNELIKYFEMDTNIEDALTAYSKFNLFDNNNRAIRIEQKLNYLNNPRYLSFLYEMDPKYLEIESVNNLFLTDEGKNWNSELYKKYTRSFQDNVYDNVNLNKKYFILRILEKIYLENISKFWSNESRFRFKSFQYYEYNSMERLINLEEEQEYKYNLLKEVLIIREQILPTVDAGENSRDQTLDIRITLLKEVLTYLFKHFDANNYRTKTTNITSLVENLYSIPIEYFKDKNVIEIPSTDELFVENVSYLKRFYNDIFYFRFTNFSEGEFIYLNLFSNVYKYLEHSGNDDCILLLDEPDINLHPEWSRRLIYDLIRLVENNKKEGKIQIIITSHSPFIVTDFPKQNIFAFKLNCEDDRQKYLIENPEFGFAANIYDLIADTFFMDASIGEFALQKIKSLKDINDKTVANSIIEKVDDLFIKKHITESLD
jgi:predicted ATPase